MTQTTPLYLAVDGGSFFTPRENVRDLVDNTNLTGMVRMGYAAATIGEYDLRMGAGYLIERAVDHSQYALVWVKNGIIYAIGGFGDGTNALAMANSLK